MPTWKRIPRYPNYEISDQGQIQRDGELRKTFFHKGYERIGLYVDGVQHNESVHVLVLETYVGPCPDGLETRHFNGTRADNRLCNLEWATSVVNQRDKLKHGTHHHAAKTHCAHGHEFDAANTYRPPARPHTRECRACRRATMARARA